MSLIYQGPRHVRWYWRRSFWFLLSFWMASSSLSHFHTYPFKIIIRKKIILKSPFPGHGVSTQHNWFSFDLYQGRCLDKLCPDQFHQLLWFIWKFTMTCGRREEIKGGLENRRIIMKLRLTYMTDVINQEINSTNGTWNRSLSLFLKKKFFFIWNQLKGISHLILYDCQHWF